MLGRVAVGRDWLRRHVVADPNLLCIPHVVLGLQVVRGKRGLCPVRTLEQGNLQPDPVFVKVPERPLGGVQIGTVLEHQETDVVAAVLVEVVEKVKEGIGAFGVVHYGYSRCNSRRCRHLFTCNQPIAGHEASCMFTAKKPFRPNDQISDPIPMMGTEKGQRGDEGGEKEDVQEKEDQSGHCNECLRGELKRQL